MGFQHNPENINRKGRPRKSEAFTDILQERLNGKADEWLVDKLIELAEKGDKQALFYLSDRQWGKATEKIKHEIEKYEYVLQLDYDEERE